eukprot:11172273-Lingulodinium_polyedra.AAC.1
MLECLPQEVKAEASQEQDKYIFGWDYEFNTAWRALVSKPMERDMANSIKVGDQDQVIAVWADMEEAIPEISSKEWQDRCQRSKKPRLAAKTSEKAKVTKDWTSEDGNIQVRHRKDRNKLGLVVIKVAKKQVCQITIPDEEHEDCCWMIATTLAQQLEKKELE